MIILIAELLSDDRQASNIYLLFLINYFSYKLVAFTSSTSKLMMYVISQLYECNLTSTYAPLIKCCHVTMCEELRCWVVMYLKRQIETRELATVLVKA